MSHSIVQWFSTGVSGPKSGSLNYFQWIVRLFKKTFTSIISDLNSIETLSESIKMIEAVIIVAFAVK